MILGEAAGKGYRDLIRREYEKYTEAGDQQALGDASLRLTTSDIESCVSDDVQEKLEDAGKLIEYDDGTYRTSHFDLLFRIVNIRNREQQPSLVSEHKIEIEEQYVPDFDTHPIKEVLSELPDEHRANVISQIESVGIETVSSHQRQVIESLLDEETEYLSLEAPTASGKSLSFLLPAILKSFYKEASGRNGTNCLLLYPRKALARDQYSDILHYTASLNRVLSEIGAEPITVGLEDGDRERVEEYDHGQSYRGLDCVHDGCDGVLEVQNPQSNIHIRCSNHDSCPLDYSHIVVGKEPIRKQRPTITVSNLYMVYRNLLLSGGVDRLQDVEFVVLDEAHVNTSYKGGHVSYILQLLQDVTSRRGESAQMVFSSATMAQPKEFIANLAAIDPSELTYINYEDAIESADVETEKRLLIHLYLLPTPRRAVETLNQAITLILGLWSEKHGFRAINFIDSIGELNKMKSFVKDTILHPGRRAGAEVIDHLHSVEDPIPSNSYSWRPLSPDSYLTSRAAGQDRIQDFRQLFATHHGNLKPSTRSTVEDRFNDGTYRYLFSTSTLEVGIDLSGIAAVVQYQLPPTGEEGVIQRVGRAGRDPSTQRVGLGILMFSPNPASQMYMYDENLTRKLRDPKFLDTEQISNTRSIKLQHVLSLVMYSRALRDKKTYLEGDQRLESEKDVLVALRNLSGDLDGIDTLNDRIGLLTDKELEDGVERFRNYIDMIVEGREKEADANDTVEPDIVISRSLRAFNETSHLKKDLVSLRAVLESENEFTDDLDRRYSEFVDTVDELTDILAELSDSIHRAWTERDESLLTEWYDSHYEDFVAAREALPAKDDIEALRFQHVQPWINDAYGSPANFHNETGHRMSDISDDWGEIRTKLSGNGQEQSPDGVRDLLADLDDSLQSLKNMDLERLSASKSIDNFHQALDNQNYGLSIFDALSEMLQGRAQFSLLLEPPRPKFEMRFE
ncbi:DEAD/DEAH box helicase [Haloplanus halophilus]|uniref:DEAD/DEAH box helicase n=1 Tax=Haloplanus halophilus TaxID=2949993 RepID=UPI00203B4F7C|nr:DEAD/DEAH box helicase [Haloplanus sp. GDY1]